jgi:hypothetical protein
MQNNTPMNTTSTAEKPDLNWSQVVETVRMLNLAVAQIEMSMKEGEDSVDTLTGVFTNTANRVKQIEEIVAQSEHAGSAEIMSHCNEITQQMQYAILAFQFYDKLTQRLSHVSDSLNNLGGLVSDNGRLFNPNEWVELQQYIREKYTMPAEHDMFEKVMQGMSVQEIIEQTPAHKHDDDDIELF